MLDDVLVHRPLMFAVSNANDFAAHAPQFARPAAFAKLERRVHFCFTKFLSSRGRWQLYKQMYMLAGDGYAEWPAS